jgi:hypothetical protein
MKLRISFVLLMMLVLISVFTVTNSLADCAADCSESYTSCYNECMSTDEFCQSRCQDIRKQCELRCTVVPAPSSEPSPTPSEPGQ